MKKKDLGKTVRLLFLVSSFLFVLIGYGVSWAADSDGDGINDTIDNCPTIANYWQRDTDGDGTGDACDTTPGCGGSGEPPCEYFDTDGDGVQNRLDNCLTTANPQQSDADSDGTGDACDSSPGCGTGCGQPACEGGLNVDTDNDFVRDGIDNCPDDCNQYQLDADNDGTGDVCDLTPNCGGSGQPVCEEGCIKDPPVVVTADQTVADKFDRYTVTGIRTPLPESGNVVPGFRGVSYLSVGDLNGDGKNEIVATSGIGVDGDVQTPDGAVAIYTQGADLGSWTQSIIYPSGTTGTLAFPNETLLRDMDGDDDLDIVVMDNFISGDFIAGIYYLENLVPDNITKTSSWALRTIYSGGSAAPSDYSSYHRARFVDVDGDGLEDIVTTKMAVWMLPTSDQFLWMEWWKKNDDSDPASFSGPYAIGEGGGSLFNLVDMDGDGDLDIVAAQFAITPNLFSCTVLGSAASPDHQGDSLIWYENPGTGSQVTQPWNRYTIDYWYTSTNPLGKGMEVVVCDLDNDGRAELIDTNHNHQGNLGGKRLWPSGVYYLGIPKDPKTAVNWNPLTIDRGNPALSATPTAAEIANDTFAVDRTGGPSQQGSPGMFKAADISGDGYPDIVVAGDGKGVVYYYESQGRSLGKLLFKRTALYKNAGCMAADQQIVDIDGDGKLEIVQAIFDTGYVKTNPSQSGSIFIFKLKE